MDTGACVCKRKLCNTFHITAIPNVTHPHVMKHVVGQSVFLGQSKWAVQRKRNMKFYALMSKLFTTDIPYSIHS